MLVVKPNENDALSDPGSGEAIDIVWYSKSKNQVRSSIPIYALGKSLKNLKNEDRI